MATPGKRKPRAAALARATPKQVWASLSGDEQMQLVAELVATREAELRLAYSDVIAVGYGLRTRTRAGKRKLLREPCVAFMVRRKWPKSKKPTRAQAAGALPTFLLAYCTSRTFGRAVCAVPTDVESASRYRAHAQRGRIRVREGSLPAQLGVATCAVKVPGSRDLHIMSCHHVLAMSTVTSPDGAPALGASVEPQSESGNVFATLSDWLGELVAHTEGLSFDAALAKVSDATAAARMLGATQPLQYLDDNANLPLQAQIVRPSPSGPETLDCELVKIWKNFAQIDYFDGGTPPMHAVVVEWKLIGAATRGGDSGSPVISQDGATLLGMHIAGANPDAAFMLPANQLFVGLNYGQSGDLELVRI